ncbi:MAG: CvpA family protein [Candidatus Omnitrophica bacterium]|nr:CvpA family protein [Candidatus Omnitrophota bacterium]
MVAILIRIVYIGIQGGFVLEMFKFLGALLTVFVTLHYYAHFAQFLMHITKMPWLNVAEVISFLSIWLIMFLVCKLIRDGMFMLFTIDAQSFVNKWGGALLGIGRFFIVGSMTMFFFLISGTQYLEAKTAESFSCKYVIFVAPKFYSAVCEGFVAKIFSGEKVSAAVREQLKKVEPR